MLSILRGFEERDQRVDLFISNYVYEKVYEGTHTAIGYKFALPRKKIFSWDQIGHFRLDQNLLMHSLCYRTDVLRESNLPMPPHTFYVDNIYAYVPLPRCKTMYYADIDLYRYFIGREGQSVNEATMVKRLDQQFRVTRIMMESYHLYSDVESSRLRSYMMGYFTMMMAICSVLTKLSEEDCADERLKTLWNDLKAYDERMYRRGTRDKHNQAPPGNLPTKPFQPRPLCTARLRSSNSDSLTIDSYSRSPLAFSLIQVPHEPEST